MDAGVNGEAKLPVGAPAPEERMPCRRQVYASMEVAATMTSNLRGMSIYATPERCMRCGLVHLAGDRET